MSWTVISTDDVLAEFTPAESARITNIQGATDGLPSIVTKAIAAARSQINAGGNQLDQTSQSSLPDAVIPDVIAIIRWRWLASIPALKALKTDERREAYADGARLLKEISSQDPRRPRTELPANPDVSPVPLIQPSVGTAKLSDFTSDNEEGVV